MLLRWAQEDQKCEGSLGYTRVQYQLGLETLFCLVFKLKLFKNPEPDMVVVRVCSPRIWGSEAGAPHYTVSKTLKIPKFILQIFLNSFISTRYHGMI